MPQRRKSALPKDAQRAIIACARLLREQHKPAFRSNPELRRVAGKLLTALLPPRPRRRGRPCEPHISLAIRLLKRAPKTHPGESPIDTWDRICGRAVRSYRTLDRGKRREERNNLKAAVRSRVNTRIRRSKSHQNVPTSKSDQSHLA
jgi:hypothetical protein